MLEILAKNKNVRVCAAACSLAASEAPPTRGEGRDLVPGQQLGSL